MRSENEPVHPNSEFGILVVDDDEDMNGMLADLLSAEGYKTYTASTAIKAISILSQRGESIYLILLDQRMPEMSGTDMLQHLININTHPLSVIMITGYFNDETVREFYKNSNEDIYAYSIYSKPIDVSALLKEVEKGVEQAVNKRKGLADEATNGLKKSISSIERKLDPISELVDMRYRLEKIEKSNKGFLHELGKDMLKTVLIAVFIVVFFKVGLGDYLYKLISD